MRRLLTALLILSVLAAVAARQEANGRPPEGGFELRVLGYSQWRAGGPVSLRVIAYDARDARAVQNVPVEITVRVPKREHPAMAFKGSTNEQGTLDVVLQVPRHLEGGATLRVAATEEGAPPPLESPVHIRREQRLFLTTDKPLYQPGQTIHVRMLALDEPALTPVANTSVTLEIEDARANKVFKKETATDRFGVVAATFELASEVNMGEYHVRCTLGTGSNAPSSEKSVTVKRYVLPKFKIAVKTEKAWYQPNEILKGTVQADYFFGKPVANATVSIEARTFDTETRVLGTINGTTSASGTYAFELKLPEYLVGQPLDKGKATVGLSVRLLDGSQHAEEAGTQVAVVTQPISVEVFPESGRLIPGLPNRIYVLTTYPDGSPAPSSVGLKVGRMGASTRTDETGFGELTVTPPREVASKQRGQRPRYHVQAGRYDASWDVPTQALTGTVTARDDAGHEASSTLSLSLQQTSQAILVRPEKALYRVGDVFHAQVLSSTRRGEVYLDFIRDDQTILTRSVSLTDGRGEVSFPLAADTFGAITVHGYQIQSSSDVVRDTRKIFVQPARDLLVTVSADKASYRPGEESRLTFIVKDAQGTPQLAVLGVDIVDESLFALAERRPGLERVYFLLEKEMMASRYEVHGLGMADVVREREKIGDPKRQRMSAALFAQLPSAHPYSIQLDTFSTRLQQMYERMTRVQTSVYTYQNRHGSQPPSIQALVEEGMVSATDARDAWGRPFGLRAKSGVRLVYSVGPDGLAGNADDVDYYALAQQLYAGPRGEVLGGGRAARADAGMPMPMPQAAATETKGGGFDQRERDVPKASSVKDESRSQRRDQSVRVREFFPETLYTAPRIVTDGSGRATIGVPMADSITTWRLSAFASSLTGKMGNASSALRVFQDFFVDIDAPLSLTQNDIVTVPVAVYNYLPTAQTVHLRVEAADWFELLDGPTRQIKLAKDQVSGASFRIRALRPGTFPLTVHASGTKLSDAVRRQISVMPDGRAFVTTRSDRLSANGLKTVVDIPGDAVPHASKMFVTLYPGVFSQVVEGLDSILRMPGGCFEQTSSSTYPNVLATSYLRKMRKTTPEISMKAEGYINTGYQRLLTFEVPGGGFSVFGQAPANPILTAYGLMEFADMARVHEVDPALISRTSGWLLAQQGKDGAWTAGRQGFYAEGWSNVPNSNLVATAYITWALVETGDKSPGIQRAIEYVRQHLKEARDPYTAALAANALVAWNPKDPAALQAVDTLLAMRVDDKDATYWRTQIATAAYGTGKAGDIETTALATLALLQSGQQANIANRALAFLVRSKDAYGTWQSTQATVLTMKALLASIDKAGEKTNAHVTVLVNGKKAGSFDMTAENFDVFKQMDVSGLIGPGANEVVLQVDGSGNAMYKIATHYWRNWKVAPPPPADILAIDVRYDRKTLSKDDMAACDVQVTNLTKKVANQVMIDVGVPPGFDVKGEDLEALVRKNVISKFSLTGRQVIIYLDHLDPAQSLTLSYRLKARFPVRAQAPASRVWEYYNPDRGATSTPQTMVIE